ncbi:MAG: type IV conjugative transfer system protein TraE [Gammaproteobacteria bacterium]|nr:type IV conjugative transfer system protein TraE [Gammaproteobacteria bacterium]
MNFSALFKTWDGIQSENMLLRVLTVGLVMALVALSIFMTKQSRPIAVIPWGLNQNVELFADGCDVNCKAMWSESIALLLGNITPANAGQVKKRIEELMAPTIFVKMKTGIEQSIQNIQRDKITLQFIVRDVRFDSNKDITYVTGDYIRRGFTGTKTEQRLTRTYEFSITLNNWYPEITFFDVYNEKPRV